jgi:16S rRNA (cytidine1402-2'-O)-methyltransferase
MSDPPRRGALMLVPNALDLGTDPVPLEEVLSAGVIRIAAGLKHWVAEDAKTTRAFLKRVDTLVPLALPLQQIHIAEIPRVRKGTGGNAGRIAAGAWAELLAPAQAGTDLGLICEAGLPALADPGAMLVAAAHEAGIEVRALAGPSAIVLAIAASGLDGQRFAFVGYLPQDPAERTRRLKELESQSRRERQTQAFIETPYRNAALLAAMLAALNPDTRISLSVNLTLPGGFSRTGTVEQWRRHPPPLPDKAPAVFCLLA